MTTAARRLALASVILLGVPASLPAQRLNRVDRERVQAMLRDVRREVERRYYDSTFRGLDLGAAHDTADARIRAASGIDEALAAVAQPGRTPGRCSISTGSCAPSRGCG